MSYLGVYFHNIDNNSRLVIPSAFREKLGPEFVLLKSPDGCVFVYDTETFDGLFEQVNRQSNTPEGRRKARNFARASRSVTQDKQGRFTVPAEFIEHASLGEGVAITGMGNRIELWSQAEYELQQAEESCTEESFPEIFY